MRYSIAVAAFMAGAVTAIPAYQPEGYGAASQIDDGQVQAPTTAPAYGPATTTEVAPVPETTEAPETIYSTEHVTITSCEPTVSYCPAESTVVSSIIHPVPVTSTPVATYPVQTYPASVETHPAPVETHPVQSYPVVVPTIPVVVPVSPSAPVYPIGTAPVVPVVPSAPVYPSVPVVPSVPVGTAPAVPEQSSSLGNSPIPATSPAAPYPATTPAVPVGTGSPVVPVPIPSGTGVGSSGAVTPPQPTGSPIAPFTGAASTVGSSMAVAALAAFAAVFLA